jgi:hypothetical protein
MYAATLSQENITSAGSMAKIQVVVFKVVSFLLSLGQQFGGSWRDFRRLPETGFPLETMPG